MTVRSKLLLPVSALTLAFALAVPAFADDMGKNNMSNGSGSNMSNGNMSPNSGGGAMSQTPSSGGGMSGGGGMSNGSNSMGGSNNMGGSTSGSGGMSK
jgi:hypothetical protein